ncbi:MAG: isopenicillin N synthase family dioxygenase [Hyphomonadaceae bacterium]
MERLPVIGMAPLFGADRAARARVAAEIGAACRDLGFFYVAGHGIDEALLGRLRAASADFFARPEAEKMGIAMAHGGRAWRGFFPVGGELTSGQPDLKEGLYFGEELCGEDRRVAAGWPLHGANLFPQAPADLKAATLDFMAAATRAAHALMEGVAESLELAPAYFYQRYTRDPTVLFRIFHYPPARDESWGVGEHTDYGLLTLLAQDDVGGLQVKTPQGWIEAPPIAGTLVCNIGDMLDRLTGGLYRSTPHRVRNESGRERYSFPFFFDPAFDAEIVPLPDQATRAGEARWDGQDLAQLSGTYGDYLIAKVSKVFPELTREIA